MLDPTGKYSVLGVMENGLIGIVLASLSGREFRQETHSMPSKQEETVSEDEINSAVDGEDESSIIDSSGWDVALVINLVNMISRPSVMFTNFSDRVEPSLNAKLRQRDIAKCVPLEKRGDYLYLWNNAAKPFGNHVMAPSWPWSLATCSTCRRPLASNPHNRTADISPKTKRPGEWDCISIAKVCGITGNMALLLEMLSSRGFEPGVTDLKKTCSDNGCECGASLEKIALNALSNALAAENHHIVSWVLSKTRSPADDQLEEGEQSAGRLVCGSKPLGLRLDGLKEPPSLVMSLRTDVDSELQRWPLALAMSSGHLVSIQLCLDAGADPEKVPRKTFKVCMLTSDFDQAKVLLEEQDQYKEASKFWSYNDPHRKKLLSFSHSDYEKLLQSREYASWVQQLSMYWWSFKDEPKERQALWLRVVRTGDPVRCAAIKSVFRRFPMSSVELDHKACLLNSWEKIINSYLSVGEGKKFVNTVCAVNRDYYDVDEPILDLSECDQGGHTVLYGALMAVVEKGKPWSLFTFFYQILKTEPYYQKKFKGEDPLVACGAENNACTGSTVLHQLFRSSLWNSFNGNVVSGCHSSHLSHRDRTTFSASAIGTVREITTKLIELCPKVVTVNFAKSNDEVGFRTEGDEPLSYLLSATNPASEHFHSYNCLLERFRHRPLFSDLSSLIKELYEKTSVELRCQDHDLLEHQNWRSRLLKLSSTFHLEVFYLLFSAMKEEQSRTIAQGASAGEVLPWGNFPESFVRLLAAEYLKADHKGPKRPGRSFRHHGNMWWKDLGSDEIDESLYETLIYQPISCLSKFNEGRGPNRNDDLDIQRTNDLSSINTDQTQAKNFYEIHSAQWREIWTAGFQELKIEERSRIAAALSLQCAALLQWSVKRRSALAGNNDDILAQYRGGDLPGEVRCFLTNCLELGLVDLNQPVLLPMKWSDVEPPQQSSEDDTDDIVQDQEASEFSCIEGEQKATKKRVQKAHVEEMFETTIGELLLLVIVPLGILKYFENTSLESSLYLSDGTPKKITNDVPSQILEQWFVNAPLETGIYQPLKLRAGAPKLHSVLIDSSDSPPILPHVAGRAMINLGKVEDKLKRAYNGSGYETDEANNESVYFLLQHKAIFDPVVKKDSTDNTELHISQFLSLLTLDLAQGAINGYSDAFNNDVMSCAIPTMLEWSLRSDSNSLLPSMIVSCTQTLCLGPLSAHEFIWTVKNGGYYSKKRNQLVDIKYHSLSRLFRLAAENACAEIVQKSLTDPILIGLPPSSSKTSFLKEGRTPFHLAGHGLILSFLLQEANHCEVQKLFLGRRLVQRPEKEADDSENQPCPSFSLSSPIVEWLQRNSSCAVFGHSALKTVPSGAEEEERDIKYQLGAGFEDFLDGNWRKNELTTELPDSEMMKVIFSHFSQEETVSILNRLSGDLSEAVEHIDSDVASKSAPRLLNDFFYCEQAIRLRVRNLKKCLFTQLEDLLPGTEGFELKSQIPEALSKFLVKATHSS